MTISYYPFSSGAGVDVSQAQWEKLAKAFKANGVVKGVANSMEPYANSTGMIVRVKSGDALIQGHYMVSDAEEQLAVSAADATDPRIDLVVAQVDMVNNVMSFAVVAGTPSGSPSAPALTQSSSVWQIPLAHIAVAAAATTIAAGNVTDYRQYAGQQSWYVEGSGNAVTTSLTAVDITTMTKSFYSRGGDIEVAFNGEALLSVAGGEAYSLRLALDGSEKQVGSEQPSTANFVKISSGRVRFVGVSAGFHTVAARWLVTAGQATMAPWRYMTITELMD